MAERQSNLTATPAWQSSSDSSPGVSEGQGIERGTVDVWRVSLDVGDDVVGSLFQLLDDEERIRADRYRIDAKRTEYIVTRGCLRRVLAAVLSHDKGESVSPGEVAFDYEAHGKPKLAGAWRGFDIQFNATHSHGVSLIAVTRSSRVGIDVERLRENRDVVALASRWFSETEVAQLQALPGDQQMPAFFRGWTRKEAFVKAIGDGITYGLDQFDVELVPSKPAALLAIKGGSADAWQICHLDPSDDHVAAIALDSATVTLRCWDDSNLIQR